MILAMLGDDHIRLDTAAGGEGLNIEGEGFGPIPMLAASLALCSASVIQQYAETAHLDVYGFGVEISWTYADDPYRIGSYTITLHLPEHVPVARHRAIVRASDTCTVHHTLMHPPAMETTVMTFTPADAPEHDAHHHHAHDDEA